MTRSPLNHTEFADGIAAARQPTTHRQSIQVPGYSHSNPIPVASVIAPFLATGVLTGRDPNSRELPSTLEAQCANVFSHIRATLEAAGGSPVDILKLTIWLDDYRDRDALNREWVDMFPDPESRPARQVIAASLDGGVLIQCDFLAVLSPTTSLSQHR